MAEGVDLSWARPGGATLARAGKEFVWRYLYPDGQGGKGLDASELSDYQSNGLEVPVGYESYARRMLEGRAAGQADAKTSQEALDALHLPSDMPIYFAADFDATPEEQAAINDYLRGCADVIGVDRVGIYGGFYVVKRAAEAGVAKWFFQTYAWSGGQWYEGNHLEQYKNSRISTVLLIWYAQNKTITASLASLAAQLLLLAHLNLAHSPAALTLLSRVIP
jgi:hypothetical protein